MLSWCFRLTIDYLDLNGDFNNIRCISVTFSLNDNPYLDLTIIGDKFKSIDSFGTERHHSALLMQPTAIVGGVAHYGVLLKKRKLMGTRSYGGMPYKYVYNIFIFFQKEEPNKHITE